MACIRLDDTLINDEGKCDGYTRVCATNISRSQYNAHICANYNQSTASMRTFAPTTINQLASMRTLAPTTNNQLASMRTFAPTTINHVQSTKQVHNHWLNSVFVASLLPITIVGSMVSGKQWLKDAEAHVTSVLASQHFSTSTDPLDVADLNQPLVGEHVRAGRIVSLVKAIARLWVTCRPFTKVIKHDLMLFEFVAWSLRRHLRCFQATIGYAHAAKLRSWMDFRMRLNAMRAEIGMKNDERRSDCDARHSDEGDEQASSEHCEVDQCDDGESESNAFCANWFTAYGEARSEKPPGMPSMMPPVKRLVPTPPPNPPPMKKRALSTKCGTAVPSAAPPVLAPTPKWESIAPMSSYIDPHHSVPMVLGPIEAFPTEPFPPTMPTTLGTLPAVSAAEVALREQNAYLRGMLATSYRATW
jgi:hypothetical protein